MKKLLTVILLLLLALSLCACTENDKPELGLEPAESVPELESIVEPIAEDVTASEADVESEAEIAYSGKTEVPVPVVKQEQSEPVVSDVPPPALPEAEAGTTVEEVEPERLEAVAADFSLDSEAIEQELFRLINALRDQEGVSALGIEDSIQLAARTRAAEAFESFSHTRPNDLPYNTAFDEAGFSYAGKWHGENLSSLSCSSGSLTEEEIALKMFDRLKNSPGHYRNMTEKNFVQVGIGVAVTYIDGMVDVTSAQMFSGL